MCPPPTPPSRRWRAVLADVEPGLRAELREQLEACWPELHIVGEAANGEDAIRSVRAHGAQVVFLDVQMPRMNGLDAAGHLKGEVEIVFLTAYDQYAVRAFEQRAADYLLKPLDAGRLAETVARLRQRLEERAQGAQVSARLDALAEALAAPAATPRLEWIKAVSGTTVRLIAVDDVLAFKAVPGYTQVLTAAGEALIRTPLRDLLPRLDTRTFVQVHRNAIVNLRGVACARRLPDGRFSVELLHGRGCIETSRSRAALFREDGEA